ncbi:MAG: ECF transporter S component [Blautia sp.]|nr:ECF transporter S component [Blautia sp.]MDY3999790.1 ECF transporter S component [Blautia sp.]
MKTKQTKLTTTQITMLGLMAAILLLMAYTPLGYLNIGPLAITFNMIPVAISAIVLGPVGGAVAGSIFGLTSFLQCIGIGGTSAMGAMLFSINPVLAFIQRFVPRFLDGLLLGYIFRGMKKRTNTYVSCAVTGFFSAFLNTLFFMSALVLLFGNTEYVQGLIGGRNIIVFVCTFVGVNAVCEMVSATVLTGAVGAALSKAHLIPASQMTGDKLAKGALE